jgi:hypothetical protein
MPAGVVVYISPSSPPMYEHERATLCTNGMTIARLSGCQYGGIHGDGHRGCAGLFFVPDEALVIEEAAPLGIRAECDLFGGVVPHAFVGTKAIGHELIDDDADRPAGWSTAFAKAAAEVALPGYTVFSARDARRAAKRLLAHGSVRLKRSVSCGGGGQEVAVSAPQVDAFLEKLPADELTTYGLVLETNLRDVTTYSIGQIVIGSSRLTYYGTQRLATDNDGNAVYGGSDLVCLRGHWDVLDRIALTPEIRLAAAQARRYDAATAAYPGVVATRRNYDVAQGLDDSRRARSGVLEASWRSGGATTAELAAMELFREDPELQVVEVRAVKQFGAGAEPPRGAVVHFAADDPRDGPILRYTLVTRAIPGGFDFCGRFGRPTT